LSFTNLLPFCGDKGRDKAAVCRWPLEGAEEITDDEYLAESPRWLLPCEGALAVEELLRLGALVEAVADAGWYVLRKGVS
jgi:hypothetical protein